MGVLVLLLGLCGVLGRWLAATPAVPIDRWEVKDLVARLDDQGVRVRSVPVMHDGPLAGGAFLTTTSRSWEELNAMRIMPERIGDWDGTVYCARKSGGLSGDPRPGCWGECGECDGPFLFFGDPALRARIRAALGR